MRFALGLELDYARVTAALSERLAGQTAEMPGGHRARIDGVRLSAKGEDLVLDAELGGDLAGTLTIMARPGFDVATQSLRLEDVGFLFDAADPDLALMADLFYDRIRRRIETAANGLLAARTRGLRDALAATLAEVFPAELAPDLSSLRIAELRLRVGGAGLSVAGTAEGVLKLGR
jgi:hypothetical protein